MRGWLEGTLNSGPESVLNQHNSLSFAGQHVERLALIQLTLTLNGYGHESLLDILRKLIQV